MDGDRVVGMITEADLARHLPDDQLAEFVQRVYAGR
jgi:CBS domain-containing protein